MGRELVAGVFETERALLDAVVAARREELAIEDALTPYPVHGLDRALELRPSILPTVCFRFAAAGLAFALGFEYYASLFDWPMNIGGKSFSASPALMPVAFELTVLFASLGTVGALFVLRRLGPTRTPLFADLRGVDDRFVLALRALKDGPGAAELERFLKRHGAAAVATQRVA
jgi:hypothetical protein